MIINWYISEGHRATTGPILTIVHCSCCGRHGNKHRQQSAPMSEACPRPHTQTHTHTHINGTIKPCILIRQSRSNWANPHFRIDCPRRSNPPLSRSPALTVSGLRLSLPIPSVAHVDCKAVYWETMGSRLCCQAPLISIISITLQSLRSWGPKP